MKIDKTTTLPSIVNLILEEKRRLSSDTSSESALAAKARSNGKAWCRNCKMEGHDISQCWKPGGGREGQKPKRRRNKKGQEKAHIANGQEAEQSNVVTKDECLAHVKSACDDIFRVPESKFMCLFWFQLMLKQELLVICISFVRQFGG